MTCNLYALLFPGFLVSGIIDTLARFLLPNDMKQWLTEGYLPEIIKATKHNKIPTLKRLGLFIKFCGVFIKLIYAFAYQE